MPGTVTTRGELGGVTGVSTPLTTIVVIIDNAHGGDLLTSAVKFIPLNGEVNRECDKGEQSARTYNCFLSNTVAYRA